MTRVNSHTNATSKRWHLWDVDLRFALNSTPGWLSVLPPSRAWQDPLPERPHVVRAAPLHPVPGRDPERHRPLARHDGRGHPRYPSSSSSLRSSLELSDTHVYEPSIRALLETLLGTPGILPRPIRVDRLFSSWHADGCHPGGSPGADLKSISHRCHPILVAFVWELTQETIHLPLGCLQGGDRPGRDSPQPPPSGRESSLLTTYWSEITLSS